MNVLHTHMYQYQAFNEHVLHMMWVYVFYTGTTCSTTYMNVLTTVHITDDLKRVVHFF